MANCENCNNEHRTGSEHAPVPYIVYEADMARSERHIKRMWIALIVAIVMVFASNIVWLYAWMQYDYTSEEIIVDSQDGGNASYIGQDGNIYNGEGYSTQENQEEKAE